MCLNASNMSARRSTRCGKQCLPQDLQLISQYRKEKLMNNRRVVQMQSKIIPSGIEYIYIFGEGHNFLYHIQGRATNFLFAFQGRAFNISTGFNAKLVALAPPNK